MATTLIQVEVEITDRDVDDMMVTAGFGAIDYWAELRHRGSKWTVVEQETNSRYILTRDQIREAFAKLANPRQQYCARYIHYYFVDAVRGGNSDGIDAGCIDAEAADVLVQIACFDEIVYG